MKLSSFDFEGVHIGVIEAPNDGYLAEVLVPGGAIVTGRDVVGRFVGEHFTRFAGS